VAGHFLHPVDLVIPLSSGASHNHPTFITRIPLTSHNHHPHPTFIPKVNRGMSTLEEINRRGIFTEVEVNGVWKILILHQGSPEPKELTTEFPYAGAALKAMRIHCPLLQRATNKAFKMAWDTQRVICQR